MQNQLQGRFLNFMSILIYCEATNSKLDKDLVFNYDIINDICKKTWSSFYKDAPYQSVSL